MCVSNSNRSVMSFRVFENVVVWTPRERRNGDWDGVYSCVWRVYNKLHISHEPCVRRHRFWMTTQSPTLNINIRGLCLHLSTYRSIHNKQPLTVSCQGCGSENEGLLCYPCTLITTPNVPSDSSWWCWEIPSELLPSWSWLVVMKWYHNLFEDLKA